MLQVPKEEKYDPFQFGNFVNEQKKCVKKVLSFNFSGDRKNRIQTLQKVYKKNNTVRREFKRAFNTVNNRINFSSLQERVGKGYINRRRKSSVGFPCGPYQFIENFSESLSANMNKLKKIRTQLGDEIEKISNLENDYKREKHQKNQLLDLNVALKRSMEQILYTVNVMKNEKKQLNEKIETFKKFIDEKDKLLIQTLKREEIEVGKLTHAIGNLKNIDNKKSEMYKNLFKICRKNQFPVEDTYQIYKQIKGRFDKLKPKQLLDAIKGNNSKKKTNITYNREIQNLLQNVKNVIDKIEGIKDKHHNHFKREMIENHRYIMSQNEMLLNLYVNENKMKMKPSYITFKDVEGYLEKLKNSYDKNHSKKMLIQVYKKTLFILNNAFDYQKEQASVFKYLLKSVRYFKKELASLKNQVSKGEFFKEINFDYIVDYFKKMRTQWSNNIFAERDKNRKDNQEQFRKAMKKIKSANDKKIKKLQDKIKDLKNVNSQVKNIEKLKNIIKQKDEKIEYLLNQRKELQKKNEEINSNITVKQNKMQYGDKLLKVEHDELKKKYEDLKEDLKDSNSFNDDLKLQLDYEKKSNENFKKTSLEKDETIKKLEEQVFQLKENASLTNNNYDTKKGKGKGSSRKRKKKKNMNKYSQTKSLLSVFEDGEEFKKMLQNHKKLIEINRKKGMNKSIQVIVKKPQKSVKIQTTKKKKKKKENKLKEKYELKLKKKINEINKINEIKMNEIKKEMSIKDRKMKNAKNNVITQSQSTNTPSKKRKKKKIKETPTKKTEKKLMVSDMNPDVKFLYSEKKTEKSNNQEIKKLLTETTETKIQTDYSCLKSNVFQFLSQMMLDEQRQQYEKMRNKNNNPNNNKKTYSSRMFTKIREKEFDHMDNDDISEIVDFIKHKYKEKKKVNIKKNKFSFENFNGISDNNKKYRRRKRRKEKKNYEDEDQNDFEKFKEREKKKLEEQRKKRMTLPNVFEFNKLEEELKFKRKKKRKIQKKKLKTLLILTQKNKNKSHQLMQQLSKMKQMKRFASKPKKKIGTKFDLLF